MVLFNITKYTQLRKDIKNLKYVKTIKKYKISIEIHQITD